MIKTFVYLFALLGITTTHALACEGEALVIGTVTVTKRLSTDCIAYGNYTYFKNSQVCPLDESTLVSEGVRVGLVNGHECAFNVGDQISGVIESRSGTFYLDN